MSLIKTASEATTDLVKNVTPNALQGDNWFGRNKTKLLGLAGITISFLLVDPTLAADLPPKVLSWTMRVLGVLTLWVGFLNNPESKG